MIAAAAAEETVASPNAEFRIKNAELNAGGENSDRGTGTQSTFSSKTMTDCQSPAVTLLPLAGLDDNSQRKKATDFGC